MKSVVLSFPSVTRMTEFILQQRVSHVLSNSKELTLTGVLSDEEIAKACTVYRGQLLKMAGVAPYK